MVSIRAARTGGDLRHRLRLRCGEGFNPRRPHGRRLHGSRWWRRRNEFQSAPPARAATGSRSGRPSSVHGFNPRRPHGRRRGVRRYPLAPVAVSIRAARTGGDGAVDDDRTLGTHGFQSAPPARAATGATARREAGEGVSIRAARTGGDGRRVLPLQAEDGFQSAPPARAATGRRHALHRQGRVSIRAARTGGDAVATDEAIDNMFQSAPPARAATCCSASTSRGRRSFNPRRPHGRRRVQRGSSGRVARFNPRRPHGRRPLPARVGTRPTRFNPRRPHGRRPPARRRRSGLADGFNPRRPHGRRRAPRLHVPRGDSVSIRAARTGGDPRVRTPRADPRHRFNPRRPHGRRPATRPPSPRARGSFQSAPPARAATQPVREFLVAVGQVSIRAARTGGDFAPKTAPVNSGLFQSAPPARAATTFRRWASSEPWRSFQSAPPARAATRPGGAGVRPGYRFNPRRPHGRRRPQGRPTLAGRVGFNPRRPHGRRPARGADEEVCTSGFNPRRPHGRRRDRAAEAPQKRRVSIRAARTGGDATAARRPGHGRRVSIRAARTGGDESAGTTTGGLGQVSIRAARTGGDFIYLDSTRGYSVSIRAARTGGDTDASRHRVRHRSFNPRRPHGRRRGDGARRHNIPGVSIRAARTGGDDISHATVHDPNRFNPRRPHGRRRYQPRNRARSESFQSAPPARAATRLEDGLPFGVQVSIRAARTGGDDIFRRIADAITKFQSAPPARAATRPCARSRLRWRGFNPRRPHGRRRGAHHGEHVVILVSIRAARTGGDLAFVVLICPTRFQSAPPARAATLAGLADLPGLRVSIRAARTGGDWSLDRSWPSAPGFNPRRPHGRRHGGANITTGAQSGFQSAPPARAATRSKVSGSVYDTFQSAPPARAATAPSRMFGTGRRGFNPRRPHGRRLPPAVDVERVMGVSIRAARTGGDYRLGSHGHPRCVSIRAARTGGDVMVGCGSPPGAWRFNPRRPHGRRLEKQHFRTSLLVVSIRAARTGGDQGVHRDRLAGHLFQSAPPARAATKVEPAET